ncbi:MAG: type II/IV secretion system protein [Candidatus Sungbacteria bacterium]|nr:type II/IV secretion system protein [Candidatus Sungbacteria bacterium]
MALFQEEKQQHRLELLRRKEEEDSVRMLADRYDLSYIDLSTFPIDLDAVAIISEDRARRAELVIFNATGKRLKIALRNPKKEETQTALNALKRDRYTYDLFLVSAHGLAHGMEAYQKTSQQNIHEVGAIRVSEEKIAALQEEIQDLAGIKDHVEKTFYGRTSDALEIILAGALAVDASDLHLEPQTDSARLRFRLDGVLHDVAMIPTRLYAFLLSRIKLISELKLNVHDKAQDGRFTIRIPGKPGETATRTLEDHADEMSDIEVRVSTLPGPNGENAVMRILDPKSISVGFEDLGMQPWIIKTMAAELDRPNGMILNTGPTGSGKTTTLYTFLKKIHTPEVKIITLEDPIEYHLTGIEQTQIDAEKGYDFANGLRAIVRQDPDVILVGEIRDAPTAETATNAAQTGHLVFSTLHTNNAAGAIPRLIALGVRLDSIAAALKVTMAQRLVRILCTNCRVPAALTSELSERIQKEMAGFPAGVPIPGQEIWKIFSPSLQGCAACSGMKYKGRIGVYEIILSNEEIQNLILKGNASEFDLIRASHKQGQITMQQDGLLKILAGVTDFAERDRIVG